MRNVEIKAVVHDMEKICKIAEELSGGPPEIIHQDDTFYKTNNGRLKMRIYADKSATLVRYSRSDVSGPKLSDYDLLEFSNNETERIKQLDDILRKCMGARGRVVKERKLYMVGQTRVHIDKVEDLGDFMELEVVLRPEQTLEEGQDIAKDIQTKLGWETHEQSDLICEMCVVRLREALTFKRNILATHELLQEAIDMKDVKQFPSIDVEMETQVKEEWIEDGSYNDGLPDAFEDVEYLNEEDGIQTPEPKRKWPKKKKKSERLARYKQYSADDMRQAIKAVRNGEMTCTIAAITYGVPKKTLTAKANDKDRNEDDGKDSTSEKHYKLIEEIKNILKFTNAIPFKTKTTRYYCAYCSTDGPIFEDGDCLRLHTRLEHDKERLRGVEKFMRPQWMNEIVKLDIEGLHCTTCRVRLPDWNKMFVHFANAHNIEFDQAYTRVIPYALTSQLRCVLCKESFHNYGHVDSHMNHHYSNYICHQCGDTFLAASRFDKHLKVHKIGNYPCELCDKVFTLEKYRTKHKNLVHDQKSMVKCLYCSEKFVGLFQRHLHVTEHHKDKVKVYTCELCGNCYTWKTYFLAHMRRRHGTDKKHQCKHCDKSFLMKYELRNHMIRHTDEKFLCGLCGKSFKRMLTLKKHCLAHEEFSAED